MLRGVLRGVLGGVPRGKPKGFPKVKMLRWCASWRIGVGVPVGVMRDVPHLAEGMLWASILIASIFIEHTSVGQGISANPIEKGFRKKAPSCSQTVIICQHGRRYNM